MECSLSQILVGYDYVGVGDSAFLVQISVEIFVAIQIMVTSYSEDVRYHAEPICEAGFQVLSENRSDVNI